VEWIDLSGHWAIAVGYDYRNESDPWDDVLILADPYDRYDDYCDGYSFVNAIVFTGCGLMLYILTKSPGEP